MEKWTILRLGQGKYNMTQECLIVPESKTMLKKNKGMGNTLKGQGSHLKEFPMVNAGKINK